MQLARFGQAYGPGCLQTSHTNSSRFSFPGLSAARRQRVGTGSQPLHICVTELIVFQGIPAVLHFFPARIRI